MQTVSYRREDAVAYAHQWAFLRNPEYYNFDPVGGDCTNFISQCIYAGTGIMNFTPTYGWYYINLNQRSPAWSGVEYLHRFLISNKEEGPFGEEVFPAQLMLGDIIQLSFTPGLFSHSLIIVQIGSLPAPDNILVAAHTLDSDYRPLISYQWHAIRYIHIGGYRSA